MDLIEQYFKPLSNYKIGEHYSQGILNQPLWFYRQKFLNENHFEIKLEKTDKLENDLNVKTLLKCIKLSLQNKSYKDLTIDLKNELHIIENSEDELSKYAVSLLITFQIREDDPNLRNIAVKNIKIKNLIDNTFIDLRFAKLSDLDINGLNLSGQNLNGLKLVKTSFQEIKFSYSSLEKSDFSSSFINNCYFDNTNIFGSNFAKSIAESCHFENCFLGNVNFNEAKFTQCLFNGSDFKESKFENSCFNNSNFVNINNLQLKQSDGVSFLNECLINDDLFISFSDFFKSLSIKIKSKLINENYDQIFINVIFGKIIISNKN